MITAQTTATYEPVSSSIGAARYAAAKWLEKQGVQEGVIDDVVLCLSEVVTNAVKAQGPTGRRVMVRLAMQADAVRFSVRDDNNAMPLRSSVAADDTCGRGLLILDAVASAWGVMPLQRGKFIWCEVSLKPVE